jgi:hypothetical protein
MDRQSGLLARRREWTVWKSENPKLDLIALRRLRQKPVLDIRPLGARRFGQITHRTKVFHVKRFGKAGPDFRTKVMF